METLGFTRPVNAKQCGSSLSAHEIASQTSVLVADTNDIARTQVNSELPRNSGIKERQQHRRPPVATGTLPGVQAIHMEAACPNAQRCYQRTEDDLEHAGQTYSSHSQRLPAHLNGAGAQARGTSRASSPWIHLECYSHKGLQADVTSGPALGLVLCLQVFVENWTICLYQLGCWHESCQWQGTATFLVHQPSFAQLL